MKLKTSATYRRLLVALVIIGATLPATGCDGVKDAFKNVMKTVDKCFDKDEVEEQRKQCRTQCNMEHVPPSGPYSPDNPYAQCIKRCDDMCKKS